MRWLSVSCLTVLAACGRWGYGGLDPSADDAGWDAPSDARDDGPSDALDSTSDAPANDDASLDADARAETDADAETDAGTGADAAFDSGDGAPTDSEADAAIDAGPDAGSEADCVADPLQSHCRCYAGVSTGSVNVCFLRDDHTTDCQGSWTTTIPTIGNVERLAVSGSWQFICALLRDHSARCMGDNFWGQLGDGTTFDSYALPVAVGTLDDVEMLSTGQSFACALRSTGDVECWGDGNQLQLGNGEITDSPSPTPATAVGGGVRAIRSQGGHSCALRSDGATLCWGNGHGVGPAVIVGAEDATHLAVGEVHACALLEDETVACWGNNGSGQLGATLPAFSATAVVVPGLTGVRDISAGAYHTCARLETGAIECWGDDSKGQLGDGAMIAAGPRLVGTIDDAREISMGGSRSCALRGDGSVWCWGDNTNRVLTPSGEDLEAPVSIRACP